MGRSGSWTGSFPRIIVFNASPSYIAPFDCDCEEEKSPKIIVTQNSNTEIDLPITVYPAYDTTDEIMKVPVFSHKIQVKDKVCNIEELPNEFSFDMESGHIYSVGKKEYNGFKSKDVIGLTLLVEQDDSSNTPVGVLIEKNDIKLGGGVTVGSKINSLTNTTDGLIGTPSYCMGSPLVGMGLDDTDFVFIDNDIGWCLEAQAFADGGRLTQIKFALK